jgi:GTP:adenosylcobinamide-phosphate guanylyltransferase
MKQVDAIVLAGSKLVADDPLTAVSDAPYKSLIKIAGVPMVVRVVAALHAAQSIGAVCVVGLPPDAAPPFERPVTLLPDSGSMIRNGMAGLAWAKQRGTDAVVLGTADIPLITSAMVDELVAQADVTSTLLNYTIIRRETMEARFPNAARTYTRLRDLTFTGGDIHVMQTAMVDSNVEFWEALALARKKPWRVAHVVGWRVLFKLLTRRLTIADIEATATRIFGAPCRAVLSDRAELGMDIDRPTHLDTVLREFVE